MENKETKNNKAEELSDEALDEVSGGISHFQDYQTDDRKLVRKSSGAKPFKAPGEISVPTVPGAGSYRKI